MDTEAVNLRLPRAMIEAVDSYRRDLPNLPSRPEAIRLALKDWLTGAGWLKSAEAEDAS